VTEPLTLTIDSAATPPAQNIARATAAGFYSHVTKPLNLKVLAEVLQRLADERRELETNVDYDISAGPVF